MKSRDFWKKWKRKISPPGNCWITSKPKLRTGRVAELILFHKDDTVATGRVKLHPGFSAERSCER